MNYYHTLMKEWLFTKSNSKSSTIKYGIGNFRSDNTLRRISCMEVGSKININGYTLTRVQ